MVVCGSMRDDAHSVLMRVGIDSKSQDDDIMMMCLSKIDSKSQDKRMFLPSRVKERRTKPSERASNGLAPSRVKRRRTEPC